MKVQGEVKEGISSKGNKYVYIEIQITPTYTKKVFLDSAELELLKLTVNK